MSTITTPARPAGRAAAAARAASCLALLLGAALAACAPRTTTRSSAGSVEPTRAATPAAIPAAGATPARGALDLTGHYTWTMHDADQYAAVSPTGAAEITGTMHVIPRADRLDAVLTSSIGPEFHAKSVTQVDETLTVLADTPYGELRFELAVRGDSMPATWAITGGFAGNIAGSLAIRRRP